MEERKYEQIISPRPDHQPDNLDNKQEKIDAQLGVEEKNTKNKESINFKLTTPSIKPRPIINEQEERKMAIDAILEESLNDVFLNLNSNKQKEFKKKGEETVNKINSLLNSTKVKVGKIISLIKEWLKIIPGINKFFLEQEAKIKADKIIEIKNKF